MEFVKLVDDMTLVEVVGERGLVLARQQVRQAGPKVDFEAEAVNMGLAAEKAGEELVALGFAKAAAFLSRCATLGGRGVRGGKLHPNLEKVPLAPRPKNWFEEVENAELLEGVRSRNAVKEARKMEAWKKVERKAFKNNTQFVNGVCCKVDKKRDCGYVMSPYFAKKRGFNLMEGVVQSCADCGGWRLRPCCVKGCLKQVMKSEPRRFVSECGVVYWETRDVRMCPSDAKEEDVRCFCVDSDGKPKTWLSKGQRKKLRTGAELAVALKVAPKKGEVLCTYAPSNGESYVPPSVGYKAESVDLAALKPLPRRKNGKVIKTDAAPPSGFDDGVVVVVEPATPTSVGGSEKKKRKRQGSGVLKRKAEKNAERLKSRASEASLSFLGESPRCVCGDKDEPSFEGCGCKRFKAFVKRFLEDGDEGNGFYRVHDEMRAVRREYLLTKVDKVVSDRLIDEDELVRRVGAQRDDLESVKSESSGRQAVGAVCADIMFDEADDAEANTLLDKSHRLHQELERMAQEESDAELARDVQFMSLADKCEEEQRIQVRVDDEGVHRADVHVEPEIVLVDAEGNPIARRNVSVLPRYDHSVSSTSTQATNESCDTEYYAHLNE